MTLPGLLVTPESVQWVAATPAYTLVPRPLRELPIDMARDTQLYHEDSRCLAERMASLNRATARQINDQHFTGRRLEI